MGRLIKNHWARLIVLTAATCEYSHHKSGREAFKITDMTYRSSRCGRRRLILAKDFLGLAHEEPGSRGQAIADTTDHQHHLWLATLRLGMAPQFHFRHCDPPQSGRPTGCSTPGSSGSGIAVPGHQSRHLLHHRNHGVLLGIQ
jgi:hypothetical protein